MEDATPHKTLQGHTNIVFFIAFSPNSKLIASASHDKTVRLWTLPDGELNGELRGHESTVHSVAFSPDVKLIVSGSWDRTIRTWSVETKQQVKVLNGHSDGVLSVAWSPNGSLIASGSADTTVLLWNATSGSMKKTLTGHTNYVEFVSFSQNGKLASAGGDRTAIIWDVHSGAALIRLAHSGTVRSVCFSPDDQFIVTGCEDNIVRMFNANNGLEERRFEGHTDRVWSVAISVDGSMIASGSKDRSVRLWDVASTRQVQQLDGHTEMVRSVAFSRDGKFIASASGSHTYDGSSDNTVRLWKKSTRFALVVGNDYMYSQEQQPLHHALTDAFAVQKRLRELEFQTTHVFNGTLREIEEAIDAFLMNVDLAARAKPNSGVLSMIYFSGHAFQKNDANWFVSSSLGDKFIRLQDIFEQLEGLSDMYSEVSFPFCFMLNGCRIGETAPDGLEQHANGPFATAVLKNLQRGQSLAVVCDNILADVKGSLISSYSQRVVL